MTKRTFLPLISIFILTFAFIICLPQAQAVEPPPPDPDHEISSDLASITFGNVIVSETGIETLTITNHHHHEVAGLEPMLVEPAAAVGSNPLPYYMAVEKRLTRAVAAGSVITCDMVVPDDASRLWSLRAEQDSLTF